MKTENNKENEYVTPTIRIVEVAQRSVICGSTETVDETEGKWD